MGDTKRGRERNGEKKREQLLEQEINQALRADDTPPESDEPEFDVETTELENVSVTKTDEQ